MYIDFDTPDVLFYGLITVRHKLIITFLYMFPSYIFLCPGLLLVRLNFLLWLMKLYKTHSASYYVKFHLSDGVPPPARTLSDKFQVRSETVSLSYDLTR